MKNHLDKLQDLKQTAERIKSLSAEDARFDAWYNSTVRTLKKIYGEKSHEVSSFEDIPFFDVNVAIFEGAFVNNQIYQKGIEVAILYLDDYINDNRKNDMIQKTTSKLDIFIVHGRNDTAKYKIKSFMQTLKLNPIILHEQTNRGKTIIEKFEEYSNVPAAIILFNDDDLGKYKDDDKLEKRARQNVIFEAGYFIGKLGRANTIILLDESLKIPSDLDGYVYIKMDENNRWHIELAKELKDIGYDIDLNKI